MLGKGREDELDRSYEKCGRITYSQVRDNYPANKKEWRLIEFVTPGVEIIFQNTLLKRR
jgi:hypothetical protein